MGKKSELWLEFLGPEKADPADPISIAKAHCGLCGNKGIVDTRGRMFTPAGYECGVLAFCICPNGRIMKKKGATLPK
jgi:hypothetical protein